MLEKLQPTEIELLILFDTVISHNLKVNISDVVNDSASFHYKTKITWFEIFEYGTGK
jgi:hypothetical protein